MGVTENIIILRSRIVSPREGAVTLHDGRSFTGMNAPNVDGTVAISILETTSPALV